MSVFCVCVCCVVCMHALYTCSASLFSVRRMHSWPVQAIGNGEDYAIPPDGNGEPVYDYIGPILLPNVGTIVMRRQDPVSFVMPHLIVLGNRGP